MAWVLAAAARQLRIQTGQALQSDLERPELADSRWLEVITLWEKCGYPHRHRSGSRSICKAAGSGSPSSADLVDYIFKRHDHFDADELIENLRRDDTGRRISRPTVYRTLNELVEAGLLRRMNLAGRAVYEHDYGYPQHDHLYCQKCDRLIEFHSEELQELRDAVARDMNFRATGHRFTIMGICADCRRKNHRRQSPLDLI